MIGLARAVLGVLLVCGAGLAQPVAEAALNSDQSAWVVRQASGRVDTFPLPFLWAVGRGQSPTWLVLRSDGKPVLEVRDTLNALHGRMELPALELSRGALQLGMDPSGLVAIYDSAQGRLHVLKRRDGMLLRMAVQKCLYGGELLHRGPRMYLAHGGDSLLITPFLRSPVQCVY